MEKVTLRELLDATGGILLYDGNSDGGRGSAFSEDAPCASSGVSCLDRPLFFTGVTRDNRTVQSGDLFVALIGERMNGHRFVGSALQAGAAGCLVSEEPEEYIPGKFYVKVPDTSLAMGRLAAFYRHKFSIPVIAVTGSVGKTTTKQMLASVLAQHYRVLFTEGNLNNHLGVPLTLFRLDSTYEIAVIEMGMNHAGEIAYLTQIAAPDTAVITNIGDAHIQNLGSRENILRAKCEIFKGMKAGSAVILNGDDDLLNTVRGEGYDGFSFIRVGESEGCDLRAEEIKEETGKITFTAVCGDIAGGDANGREHTEPGKQREEHRLTLTVPAPGRHMIYPALTAAAAGRIYGLSGEEIEEGIRSFTQTGKRMQIIRVPIEKGEVILLNDTYNANPQSMQAAIRILSGYRDASCRAAVLGDMFELGDFSESLHREIGRCAAGAGLDVLVTVGEAASFIAEEACRSGMQKDRVFAFPDKESAKKKLRGLLKEGSVILFKASRGMALEELAQYMEDTAGACDKCNGE